MSGLDPWDPDFEVVEIGEVLGRPELIQDIFRGYELAEELGVVVPSFILDVWPFAHPLTHGGVEFSLGYIAESRNAVDKLLQKAEAAGARLTDKPHDRPWGIYSGYFQDPDGHLWEIIWNPQLLPED